MSETSYIFVLLLTQLNHRSIIRWEGSDEDSLCIS